MHQAAGSTGAQLVLDILADEGIDTVFGYPGGAIMPLYDAIHGHRVKHVLTRHEQGAAFAAGGYARSTGKLGVCLATSGPGATNLITGILDAQMDSVPVLAITGQVRTVLMGTDAFQEADVTSMTTGATKMAVCVHDVADLERLLRAAIRIARGPRPGAVVLDIPQDILKAACAPLRPRVPAIPAAPARPSDASLDQAVDQIRRAERPIALAGGGVRTAEATRMFREFCSLLKLPYASTINALGCARPNDPRFLGMLGMHGTKAANLAVSHSDLVIAFGMRFDDRVTGRVDRFARGATVIHADIDASEISKIVQARVALRADVRATLAALIERLAPQPAPTFAAWAAEAAALGSPLPADRAPENQLSATAVLDEFFARAEPGTIVATDVGQHQMWAAQRARPVHPRDFITSAGLGAMGFGLPAAIGAQFAHPGRTVVAIVGDGGFQMSLNEMATVKRYDLPLKILLIDNQRLGMVRQWQELFYEERYSATDLSDNPDFVALAHAYRMRAESVSEPSELPNAIERFLRAKEATLLHCACFPSENVWPLIPPGATIAEVMEGTPKPQAAPAPETVPA